MSNVRQTLLKEARKLRAKAWRKKMESGKLEKEADELEKKANNL